MVETIANHPQNRHFYGLYQPSIHIGGVWHRFTHMTNQSFAGSDMFSYFPWQQRLRRIKTPTHPVGGGSRQPSASVCRTTRMARATLPKRKRRMKTVSLVCL